MSLFRTLPSIAALILLAGPGWTAEAILHKIEVPGSLYSLAFSPDGKLLAAQAGTLIYLWDARTGKEVRRITEEPFPGVWSVAFSPDSKMIYAPLQDNTVAGWEVATGKLVRMFKGHTNIVWSAAVSPDGKLLASGGEDRTVRLWDTATGKELSRLEHASGAWPFLFSRDGKELVSIGSDSTLSVWDVATGKEKKKFQTEATPWPLALSSDGRTAATVRWQAATLRLYDLTTGKELRTLPMHSGTGWNLTFTPDGRTLAAGGPDNSLCLWEAATGKERLRLTSHQGKIDALDCSPDGRTVATGGSDGKVILWDVTGRGKAGRPAPARPTAQELEALWQDLSGEDGIRAYQAGWALTAAGDGIIPFLSERLQKGAGLPEAAARRGVEVLERIGTPSARRALEQLLIGQPRDKIVEEARLSLRRLAGSK